MSKQEVYQREKNTTVSFSIHSYDSQQEDSVEVECEAELHRYLSAVDLAGDVLFGVRLDAEKVRSYLGRVVRRFDSWSSSETAVVSWMADEMAHEPGWVGRMAANPDVYLAAKQLLVSRTNTKNEDPDGTFKTYERNNFTKKNCKTYVVYPNDMFRHMVKAEFVMLLSLKVPSGERTSRSMKGISVRCVSI